MSFWKGLNNKKLETN